LNQRLVYGSFTGYGETGAESDEVAFDTTAWWARSGLMDLVRSEPDGPPARSIVGMGDHMASLAMFGAVVTALYDREKTGRGAYVGSSLMANGAWSNAASIQASLCGGEPPRAPSRAKNPNPMNNHYLCSDGRWFSLTMNVAQQERFWPQFAAFMEKPVLVDDERFNTPKARWDNPEALIAVLDDGFARKAASEWKVLFHGLGFAVAVVAHCGDLQSDEQMLANGVLIPMAEGDHLTVNSPIWVAGREKVAPRRAPEVGENTSEVLLQDLMIDAAELDRLRRAGVAS